jgi:hypothetical protein
MRGVAGAPQGDVPRQRVRLRRITRLGERERSRGDTVTVVGWIGMSRGGCAMASAAPSAAARTRNCMNGSWMSANFPLAVHILRPTHASSPRRMQGLFSQMRTGDCGARQAISHVPVELPDDRFR